MGSAIVATRWSATGLSLVMLGPIRLHVMVIQVIQSLMIHIILFHTSAQGNFSGGLERCETLGDILLQLTCRSRSHVSGSDSFTFSYGIDSSSR
jgi:hypothetical protein